MNCSALLTLISTLALALITAFYAYITYRILKANQSMLRAIQDQSAALIQLEMYDRRLKVYDAISRFISETLQYGTTDNEKLIDMLRETKHAKFLFPKDDDIKEYIDLLYQKGLDLEYKEKELNSESKVCTQERREQLVEESRKLKDWIKSQFDTVDKKFGKHLQL
ncbi:MAG: hypothetical protein JSV32_08635 [Dehalococcoidia bacterium]|nr:MAG: hypothetical protein JSV32_08635 [Dehalococcoidia bacterium]